MKNIDEILALCIEEIESGRSTLEQCLERYEPVRAQLEPLLRMATGIKPPAPVRPSQEFRTNARGRLMDYIHQEQASKRSRGSVFIAFNPFLRTGWVRAAAIIVSAIIVLSLAGTGTAYASQDSLPGEMLYPAKTFTEDFRVWLETDKAAEVALQLEFAEKRLKEMEALANKAPENLNLALSGYDRNLNDALETIGQIRAQNQYRHQLEQFSQAMTGYILMLDNIEDTSGKDNIGAFKQCREITMNHHSLALRSMSQYNGVQATEMNLQLMQNRLQRAYDTSARGRKARAEEALNQYIQLNHLGEEILAIAENSGQDTSGITELNYQAAQQHRHELSKIDGNLSEQIKSETDAAIQKMTQNQGEDQPAADEKPGNISSGQDNQPEPSTQSPDSNGQQQETDNKQQPDGQGQDSQNSQSGPGNGGGGK